MCGTACPRPSSSLESVPSGSGDWGGLETEKGCAINPGKSSLYDNGLSVDRSGTGARVFFSSDKNQKRLRPNVVLRHNSSPS